MPISNNHIIKKQLLEIYVPKQLEDTDVKEKVKQYLAHHLYPELEKLFDELGSEDEIIRIDNITIDTGILQRGYITEEITAKAILAIKQQLVEKIRTARKFPLAGSLEIVTTKQTPEQIISYFLHTGTLPWWYKKDKSTMEEIFNLLVEKNPNFILEIVEKNKKNPNVSLRIINQFSEKLLAQIIAKAGVEVYIDLVTSIPLEKRIKFSGKLKNVANLISDESQKQEILDSTKKVILYKKESDIQRIIDRFLKTGITDTLDIRDTATIGIEEILYKLLDTKLLTKNAVKNTPQAILVQLIKNGYTTNVVNAIEIFSKIFSKSKATKLLQNATTVKQQLHELKQHYQELEKKLKEDNTLLEKVLTKILGKKLYTELNAIELTFKQKTEIIKNYFLKMEVPVLVQVETQATQSIPANLKYLYTIAYKISDKQIADTIFQKYKIKTALIKSVQRLLKESIQKEKNKSIERSETINSSNDIIENEQPSSEKRSLHREYEKLQLLEYYLLTGVLPSIISNNQHRKIEKLFCDYIKNEDEITIKNVWNLLSDTTSLKRVVYTFSTEVLDKLLTQLEPSNTNFIKNSIDDFAEIIRANIDNSVSSTTIRSVLYLISLQFLIQNKGKTFRKQDFLIFITEQTAIKFRKESKNWHKSIAEHILQHTKKKYSSELKKYIQSTNLNNVLQNDKVIESSNNTNTVEQDKEGYYIENAGLVILHPYLPTMFRNLNLVEKNEFVSEEARERAVLLLQYIVTKEEVIPEHQLVLNKIICGMDITNPVPLHIDITPEEKTETEEIIKAAIEYWPAIKNTSVEGFRNSFLWREGMIRKEEEKWVLRVERKTYDMLLDKLPWGLSMIKFPWRKDIIYTQW